MNLKSRRPARVVAVATVAYSVAITIAPRLLAKPAGLLAADGSVPSAVSGLVRAIGVRDLVSAAALAVAPAGYPLTSLTAARVVSDAADAIWFAKSAPTRSVAIKVAAIAAGWSAVQAVAGLGKGRLLTGESE